MNEIRVAMVVFAYYPSDVRVRRAAEALVSSSMAVDVISLRGDGEPKKDQVNGVNVYRINLKRKRANKLRYIWQWGYFIAAVYVKLFWLHLSKRYRIVHVHNMPDILAITALLPKLSGAKVILDLHDPMPEVYMTKYSMTEFHPVIRFLKFLEKWCIRFSDLVITTNISFRDLFISRGCPPGKIHIIMNSPQEVIFNKYKVKQNKDTTLNQNGFDIMYHGHIVEMHGLDIAIEAVARIQYKIPNLTLHVYNDGNFLKQIQKQVDDLNLRDIVKFHGTVPIEKIAEAIASIDVGIVPSRMTPFTNLNFPTRIFECLIIGKPIIVPRTQGIGDYFDEDSIYFFDADNVDDLAEQIVNVYSNTSKRKHILTQGIEVYKQHRWKLQQEQLVSLATMLLERGSFKTQYKNTSIYRSHVT
jgi:glycosyltransferase involved in cell wall biosynthesis